MNFGYILLIEKPQNMDSFYSTKIIKNTEKNKRQVTKSPPFSSLPVDSYLLPYTIIFSKLFFKPTESTLYYQHAHVPKVLHL